jgi:hypothetical protein
MWGRSLQRQTPRADLVTLWLSTIHHWRVLKNEAMLGLSVCTTPWNSTVQSGQTFVIFYTEKYITKFCRENSIWVNIGQKYEVVYWYLVLLLGGTPLGKKKTYNFYLVIEVPDHVYVFYAYRLYFAYKDIYMIRYFYHKIEIVRVFIINNIDIGIGHTRSTERYNAILY